MDNTRLFSDKAEIYDKYRPAYPIEIIRYLSQFVTPADVVADIGAGTGKFTKMLCHLGCNLIAVEPNKEMLLKACDYLQNYDNLTLIRSSAEDTSLAENSIKLITCAQAFHWFDAEAFKKECQRILKPEGKVLVLWNTADYSTEIVKSMNDINERYCKGYSQHETPLHGHSENIKLLFDGDYETILLKNDLSFDMESFIGNRLSRSYAPKEKDKNYKPFLAELRQFFEKYQSEGKIVIPNVTECYIGTV